MWSLLASALGAFTRLWDFFMSPKKQKQRADAEADRAVLEHDEEKVNRILDDGLR